MSDAALAISGALVIAYATVSGRLATTPITAPMLFVGAGLLFGSSATGIVDLQIDNESVVLLAEFTLILVLFTDAARIDVGALRRDSSTPARLLGIGLPLTVGAGTVAAMWVAGGLDWYEAALVAAVLTPTDAALGLPFVTNRAVPTRVRRTLIVESGLNDGLALPAVAFFVARVEPPADGLSNDWALDAIRQIGVGGAAGAAVGAIGGLLLSRSSEHGWLDHAAGRIGGAAIAITAYTTAEAFDANGFIAAFLAGLTVGIVTSQAECDDFTAMSESVGDLLTFATFMVFGATLLGPALADASWRTWLAALLMLTAVRMVPVALALVGSGNQARTVALYGWFGPRGLASMLFGLLIITETDLERGDTLFTLITITVFCSVVLHGMSAAPLARRYGRWYAEHPDTSTMVESVEMAPQRLRGRRSGSD